jgi:hypothetical protein
MCLDSNINAYGIDPIIDESAQNCYTGTIGTIIKNEHLLEDYTFSCISCVNFLHGKDHDRDELISLFLLMKKRAEFILISEPNIELNLKEECMSNLSLIHTFNRSHNEAYHSLYKILK